jgi:hypothetical protein
MELNHSGKARNIFGTNTAALIHGKKEKGHKNGRDKLDIELYKIRVHSMQEQ